MQKYLTIGLILVLVFGAWVHGERKYEAGETAERAAWQERELARQAEIQKLQDERDQARLAAEQAKADDQAQTNQAINDTRQIADKCADTTVDSGLYRVYTR